jgi:hypothetical protein
MPSLRPVYQFQGPSSHCVIDDLKLGWTSCTAYSMAMLIDGATGGDQQPSGCRIRRLVNPEDIEGGLMLSQVAPVAEESFGVRIAVRTGTRAIPIDLAIRRLRSGRGFVLQGNTTVFSGRGAVNHAVYVHEARGIDAEHDGRPVAALVYDPALGDPQLWAWRKVAAFGANLFLNDSGTRRLGAGRLYAGFGPRRPTVAELRDLDDEEPPVQAPSGIRLRFHADELEDGPRRYRANPPAGTEVIVRRRPTRLDSDDIVDTLRADERFVGWQRKKDGVQPPGTTVGVWIGNRDGTEWVHRSGLRRTDGGG